MEIGLGASAKMQSALSWRCLNPCFSGNRVGSYVQRYFIKRIQSVLILVLVEIGLGGLILTNMPRQAKVGLNPCFSGNRVGSAHVSWQRLCSLTSLNPCFSGNRVGSAYI